LQSIAGLAPAKYGILAGATLHEVAQIVAADSSSFAGKLSLSETE
jgi:uncharacterized membrane protein YadS